MKPEPPVTSTNQPAPSSSKQRIIASGKLSAVCLFLSGPASLGLFGDPGNPHLIALVVGITAWIAATLTLMSKLRTAEIIAMLIWVVVLCVTFVRILDTVINLFRSPQFWADVTMLDVTTLLVILLLQLLFLMIRGGAALVLVELSLRFLPAA